MSLTASKKLNLTNNYIRVYTGCTSLLTDHTAYSQIHHDDAICKHSGISSQCLSSCKGVQVGYK